MLLPTHTVYSHVGVETSPRTCSYREPASFLSLHPLSVWGSITQVVVRAPWEQWGTLEGPSATSLCSPSSVPKGRQLRSCSCSVLLQETCCCPSGQWKRAILVRKHGDDEARPRLTMNLVKCSISGPWWPWVGISNMACPKWCNDSVKIDFAWRLYIFFQLYWGIIYI